MSRIPLVAAESLTGELGEMLRGSPVKLNIAFMMAHAEANALAQLRLGGTILTRQMLGDIPRELLILLVANIEGGEYEWVQHVPIAEGVGVTKAKIAAIARGDLANEAFSTAERALLAFGKQVIENVRVDARVFAEMRKHFSNREIVEAILAIGFYMTMARLTEATETDIDPPAGMAVFNTAPRGQRET